MAINITNSKYRNLGIAFAFSLALYILGFTSFFFVLPLLIYFNQSGQREQSLASLAVLLVVVLLFEIIPIRDNLSDASNFGLLSIGLFLPIVLIGCSIIWVLLSDYRLLVRYIGSSAFIAVLMVFGGIYFSSHPEVGTGIDTAAISIMDTLFTDMGLQTSTTGVLAGTSTTEFYSLVKEVMMMMVLPLSAVIFGFNVFMSIATPKYVGDDRFDRRVVAWKLPETMVWVFLTAWLLVLLDQLVDYNSIIRIAVWNFTLFMGVLYSVQGLAIMLYRLNLKNHRWSALKLFVLVAFLTMLLQGLNIVIVIGLPVLGVTETWVTYRK